MVFGCAAFCFASAESSVDDVYAWISSTIAVMSTVVSGIPWQLTTLTLEDASFTPGFTDYFSALRDGSVSGVLLLSQHACRRLFYVPAGQWRRDFLFGDN